MKAEEKKQMAEAVLQIKPTVPPRRIVRGLEVNVAGALVAQHCRDKASFYIRFAKQVQASELSPSSKQQSVERASRRARFWLLFADGLDEEADYMLSFEEMEMIVQAGLDESDLTTLDA